MRSRGCSKNAQLAFGDGVVRCGVGAGSSKKGQQLTELRRIKLATLVCADSCFDAIAGNPTRNACVGDGFTTDEGKRKRLGAARELIDTS